MSLFATQAQYRAGDMTKHQYIDEMHRQHEQLFAYADFIRDTDIASIEITDGTVIMTSRTTGVKMVCDKNDKRIAPIETLNFGSYEPIESRMIYQIIQEGFHVFDIGANVGWYTLNIAKLFKDVRIFSFEPVPMTFAYLQKNVRLNNVPHVQIYNMGFSDKVGELTFYYYPEGSGNASAVDLSGQASVQKVTCQVDRLDTFVAAHDLHVDFIKCDVEGAELLVYQGGLEVMQQYKPIIFTELLRKWSAKFGYHPNDVIGLLAGIGYSCFTVSNDRLVPCARIDEETIETNFFFLHADKHTETIHRWVTL